MKLLVKGATMQLGNQMWTAAMPFYEGLTLAQDGDPAEKFGATRHRLAQRFPNYEAFWKRHVCPATERPGAITFRPGLADVVSVITQRSYTVFIYLLEAYEFLAPVLQSDYGPRKRNATATIMYAGNALQIFAELQSALCGSPKPLQGMKDLSHELRSPIKLFPDWAQNWQQDRNSASNYRNYLTHQGYLYAVYKQASKDTLVLNRDTFQNHTAYTWTHADSHYASNPQDWVSLADACKGIVDDTTAFLDRAYSRMISHLDQHLGNPDYQRLWGWKDNQAIPTALQPTAPTSTPPTLSSVSMAGSTSSAVDPRQPAPKAGLFGHHGPPGSGDQIV